MRSSQLGTLLRRLQEALDASVESAYRDAGLTFRPRYTAVVRPLLERGPMRIRDLADLTGLSHSALSQTVAQLEKQGWVELRPGRDRRERIVHPTADALLREPDLRRQWEITAAAAADLDAELPHPLEPLLAQALDALSRESFSERLQRCAIVYGTRGINREASSP